MNLRAGDLNTFIFFENINPETPATSQGVSAAEYNLMHPSLPRNIHLGKLSSLSILCLFMWPLGEVKEALC